MSTIKEMGKIVILKKVDGLDFLVGILGGDVIPTKQDKFKHLEGELYIEEDGARKKIEGHKLYLKKDGKDRLKEFEADFKKAIQESLTQIHPYKKPIKLEVMISISMTETRLEEADVDNLTKAVLDCLTGLVFEDDSQVMNIFASKYVHPEIPRNSVFVGVRKFTGKEDSWFKNIKLFKFEYSDTEDK